MAGTKGHGSHYSITEVDMSHPLLKTFSKTCTLIKVSEQTLLHFLIHIVALM